MSERRSILVTGAAGFIGMHVSERLLREGHQVVGIDNLNDYYDPALKRDRLARLTSHEAFSFEKMDIVDAAAVADLFSQGAFDAVIHLAAQAGVRHSLDYPHEYTASNIEGTLNVLEGCRHHPIRHFIYASSSAVYGSNTKPPFSETDDASCPVSLYAATKRANELMAYVYSHLYRIPATGLRFFTVYGPWGRPDMAYYSFTKRILEGKPMQIFNHGDMQRDFIYIDDVVEAIARLLDVPPEGASPHMLYNVGTGKPVQMMKFIAILEVLLGKGGINELLPMQIGDVPITFADTEALDRVIGFTPGTPLEHGLKQFTGWYKEYCG